MELTISGDSGVEAPLVTVVAACAKCGGNMTKITSDVMNVVYIIVLRLEILVRHGVGPNVADF